MSVWELRVPSVFTKVAIARIEAPDDGETALFHTLRTKWSVRRPATAALCETTFVPALSTSERTPSREVPPTVPSPAPRPEPFQPCMPFSNDGFATGDSRRRIASK